MRATLLLLAAACAGAATPATAPPLPAPPVVSTSSPAPEPLAVADLQSFMANRSGKPRLITFWAAWCGPCVKELPAIRVFAARHPEVEVAVVNVDVPAAQPSRALPLIQSGPPSPWRNLLLQSENPTRDLRPAVPGWVDEIPFNVFQRADGSVFSTHATPMDGEALEAELRRMVGS